MRVFLPRTAEGLAAKRVYLCKGWRFPVTTWNGAAASDDLGVAVQ